jgi:hypothetical protein
MQPVSKARLWEGRIVSAVTITFLLFDATIKLMKSPFAVEATVQLGYPASVVCGLGVVLLACTLLYAIPRTSILGAILLTGYLGGAVATNVRVSAPLFTNVLFPVYVGVMAWAGLVLRDDRLRGFILPGSKS